MNIGDRIKEKRKELNLSVEDIADKLKKNRATVYRYESSDIENLPITILEPLAQILQTTPAYLMGIENKEKFKLSQEEISLLNNFNKLNDLGKNEASKRVSELSEINKYIQIEEKQEYNFAAHDDGLDEETSKIVLEKAKAMFKQMDEE